jgi:fermentation-respiration switch protein FrsA (DUF1100 family)
MPLTKALVLASIIALSLTASACSKLLFYPLKHYVRTPETLGLSYRDITVETKDNLKIHGWLLPAQGALKGSVYFLHGNAENISTHIESVKWLPEQGYQVFLIDYRGFGASEGEPGLPEVFWDIEAGFDWLLNNSDHKSIFLLGQSIGASLGLYFAAAYAPARHHLAGVISDSAFSSYYQIVRHAAGSFWLTWPLQYPFAWAMDYPYNPIDAVGRIAPIPLLICHGINDRIIPFEQAEQLYRAAEPPKTLLKTEDGHIQTFVEPDNREFVLNFLNRLSIEKENNSH